MKLLQESIKLWIEQGESNRFLLLDHFPPNQTKDLLTTVKECHAKVEWALIDQSYHSDLKLEWGEGAGRVIVIDTYHQRDMDALSHQAKLFLHFFPKARFVFMGNGCLSGIRLPDQYGRGQYLDCELLAPQDDAKLLQHARKLTPRYNLRDLVLGTLTRVKFEEAIHYIQTKEYCEQEWGFRKKHSRGHGVTLLFHGESGTGKTMAAEVVACALKLPLYQIDLSSVVSKWVGETEKNLKSIFRAAQGVKGILLFDEGDAIFGSRTDAKSSQDRYSNLEVNYLLQEIEAFDGIAILSTNYFRNMDAAFLRRFSYVINFGLPSSEQRVSIWQRNVPDEMPLGISVDFDHLSQFQLTGGNIRNCVRYAAAQAAMKGRDSVEQEDFLWAIKRELEKHDIALSRELVGEDYWRKIAPEWEHHHLRVAKRRDRETVS